MYTHVKEGCDVFILICNAPELLTLSNSVSSGILNTELSLVCGFKLPWSNSTINGSCACACNLVSRNSFPSLLTNVEYAPAAVWSG